jgi:hypothetical protein
MKTGQSRLDDTLKYLKNLNQEGLAYHIRETIRTRNPSSIGGELFLGGRKDDLKKSAI